MRVYSNQSLLFIIVLLIGCLAGLSSDIYISAMPTMATDLNVSVDHIQ